MTEFATRHPAMVLVDDDFHSARLLMRMLDAHGAPEVQWISDPDEAAAILEARAALGSIAESCVVIVDLKSSSTATVEFIDRLRRLVPTLVIAAMSPSLDRPRRAALIEAGAAAVFQRHGELALYRREVASLGIFLGAQSAPECRWQLRFPDPAARGDGVLEGGFALAASQRPPRTHCQGSPEPDKARTPAPLLPLGAGARHLAAAAPITGAAAPFSQISTEFGRPDCCG